MPQSRGQGVLLGGDARRCIESERAAEATHNITAGMVEIYNEGVWDLLAPGGKRELELAKSGAGFDLPDLTQIGAALLLHGQFFACAAWLPGPSASCPAVHSGGQHEQLSRQACTGVLPLAWHTLPASGQPLGRFCS